MVAPTANLGWRFGLWPASVHLAFALSIWMFLVKSPSGEGWFYVGILHMPTLFLCSWLEAHRVVVLPHWPDAVFLCGFGTVTWYISGWLVGRVVMIYRAHA